MALAHQKKIVVAMSGGVDSSVSAALLKNKGYKVRGIFMALAQHDLERDIKRVRDVAAYLDIPLDVVDLSESFKKEVLGYFVQSYFAGKTPNPCVVCNRLIKCGKLLDHVLSQSNDLLATGHYARIVHGSKGYQLLKGRDVKKDQSYFLCWLKQEQLAQLCFPLGEYTKEEVYGLAADFGLEGKHGTESQDVCFLKDQAVGDFLAEYFQREVVPGGIVTLDGREIGRHDGIHKYTVGQRRGLGIPDETPYYVVALDAEKNQVIVGKKEDLFQDRLLVRNVNWISGAAPGLPHYFEVKIRYRHPPARAKVDCESNDTIIVKFDEPQRAITPGQFAAFYDEDAVIGGGEIFEND